MPALGIVPGTRGAVAAGTAEPLTVLGASGVRGAGAAAGGAPGTPVFGPRGVCAACAPGIGRGPLTAGLTVGGRVRGWARCPAGPVAIVDGAAGVAGALVVRGGGRPGLPVGPAGTIGFGARGQVGMVPVGMRSGFLGTEPGEPLGGAVPAGGGGAAVVGGGPGIGVPAVVTGRGPGNGVRTGGAAWNPAPGRGMGVSIGIGGMGPDAVGGSSRKGSGVSFGGPAGGSWRRSRGARDSGSPVEVAREFPPVRRPCNRRVAAIRRRISGTWTRRHERPDEMGTQETGRLACLPAAAPSGARHLVTPR
jgi:hypothetical protein